MIKDFYDDFHERVETVEEHAKRAKGERLLGVDPETGKNVYARLGRFGPMVQIGEASDEEKPRFASLQGEQTLDNISFEEAMDLFRLPRKLGTIDGKEVEVSIGRFGPYVRFGKAFISLDKDENPLSVTMDRARELIEKKKKAEAPIAEYKGLPVQKGVGRFGPFIKWDGMFVNVGSNYDFENLTSQDVAELIETKMQKDQEKVVHDWKEEGIRVEKARWGRHNIHKGRTRVELPKSVDAQALTLEEVKAILEKSAPKKKATARKSAKKK